MNRYYEGALVEAVTSVVRDDDLDAYANGDELLAKILFLMGRGFGDGDSEPRYSPEQVSRVLNVLRGLESCYRNAVFCDADYVRHFVRLIAEGVDITDLVLEVACR